MVGRHKTSEIKNGLWDARAILKIGVLERRLEIGEVDQCRLGARLCHNSGGGRSELF